MKILLTICFSTNIAFAGNFTIHTGDHATVKIPLAHTYLSTVIHSCHKDLKEHEWTFDYDKIPHSIGYPLQQQHFTHKKALEKFAAILKDFAYYEKLTQRPLREKVLLSNLKSETLEDLLILGTLGEYFQVEKLLATIPTALTYKLLSCGLDNVCTDAQIFKSLTQVPADYIKRKIKEQLFLKYYDLFNNLFENLIESDIVGVFDTPVKSLAFHTTKPYLAALTNDNHLHLMSLVEKQECLDIETPQSLETVVISPDCSIIAATGTDHIIALWHSNNPAVLHHCRGHTDVVLSVEFSKDNSQLISTSMDNTQRTWDAHNGAQIGNPVLLPAGISQTINKAYANPSNRLLFWDNNYAVTRIENIPSTLVIYDPQTPPDCINLKGHSQAITTFATDQKNLLIATGSRDNTVRLWTLTKLKELTNKINLEHALLIYYLSKNPNCNLRDYPHLKKVWRRLMNSDS